VWALLAASVVVVAVEIFLPAESAEGDGPARTTWNVAHAVCPTRARYFEVESPTHGNAFISHKSSQFRLPPVISFDGDERRRGLLVLTRAGFQSLTTRLRS
jgi:hypothetical protein